MKRGLNILLLFIPILISSFACFVGPKIYFSLCNEETMPEGLRYVITIIFFIIPTFIIFIKTRGINPMIKIHTPQNSDSEKQN